MPAPDERTQITAIRAALEAAWNSRGTADASAIDAALSSMMGIMAAGPYVKNLTRTIHQLDVEGNRP